jgi:nucleotide-binding universal stress UspA family protein
MVGLLKDWVARGIYKIRGHIMTKKNVQNKILLIQDESKGALEALRYVSGFSGFRRMELVLFTVFSKVRDFPLDEPGTRSDGIIDKLKEREERRQKRVKEMMENSRNILIRAGVPEDAITIKIRNFGKSIARQIISEAKQGYSCVVIGRNSKGEANPGMFDYLTTVLLQALHFVPFIVVGKRPDTRKILLAHDVSNGAMCGVDFVCTMLGKSPCEVGLIHVNEINGRQDKADHKVTRVLSLAKTRFIESGFSAHQIDYNIISGDQGVAAAIVQRAKQGGHGTIVIGRRGLSNKRTVFMGRTSNRVIHLAEEHAVWLVNQSPYAHQDVSWVEGIERWQVEETTYPSSSGSQS